MGGVRSAAFGIRESAFGIGGARYGRATMWGWTPILRAALGGIRAGVAELADATDSKSVAP